MDITLTLTPKHLRLPALAAVLVLATSACREPVGSHPDRRETEPPASFSFAGADGSRAQVTRTLALDGTEILHGETMFASSTGAACCVIEDVTLDARGQLGRADVAVAGPCGGPAEPRITLDRARGEITTGAGSWAVPMDAPWVYAPLDSRPTPISAWVTLRAASASLAVRSIEVGSRRAPLVPRDQIAIETERGTTVVVGNEGVDVDAVFVREVRARGVTLVRSSTMGGHALHAPPKLVVIAGSGSQAGASAR